jgi:hypothetical protein
MVRQNFPKGLSKTNRELANANGKTMSEKRKKPKK